MQTLVAEVLHAWRRAERLANQLPPGTSEHVAALKACERLRDLYRELTAADAAQPTTEADVRTHLEMLREGLADA